MYENCRISEPYLGKDGRLRVYIHFDACDYKVMSYPKYLMECHLGRHLKREETVHHIDGNPLNNAISNLEIIGRKEHAKKHATTRDWGPTLRNCVWCGKEFMTTINQEENIRGGVTKGPFCSKSCVGKYGASKTPKTPETPYAYKGVNKPLKECKPKQVNCVWCGKEFTATAKQVWCKQYDKRLDGFLCSASCRGHYSQSI